MGKFLDIVSGVLTQIQAITSSAGAGDAGKIPALDGGGKLSSTMMPTGLGADTLSIETTENLSAGDLVNVYDSTGAKVRKADASNSRRANGFVLSGFTTGQMALVYFEGSNNQLSGLTPGANLFLSAAVAGGATATAPSGSGNIVQSVGVATSATSMNFEPQEPISLA